MASDLPPYLSHSQDRAVPWKGHDTFPRRVFQARETSCNKMRWPNYMDDLRVFKRRGVVNVEYYELTAEQIEKYLEDPTRA